MRFKPQKQLQSKNPFTEVNGNTISSLVLALPSVLTDGLIKQLNELAFPIGILPRSPSDLRKVTF